MVVSYESHQNQSLLFTEKVMQPQTMEELSHYARRLITCCLEIFVKFLPTDLFLPELPTPLPFLSPLVFLAAHCQDIFTFL